ncbi:conserved exported hypothetical protein [Planktothrix agardhii]|uniref:hypothetical protein n=1 Tax=Planktothrix agardhii TaxID=1160 RepID=UPI001B956D81|nr:hypothetical protein [Planktothrix agardhii]CAD0223676.1 conserved exported hypothetical protein [Planktothrix agardhii]
MKTKSTILASVGLLISVLPFFAVPNKALAECGFLDITCNPIDWKPPIDTIRDNVEGATFFSFNVRVTNKSDRQIYVRARWYVNKPSQHCSDTDGSGFECGGPEWDAGNWKLEAGEEALIVNNAHGRYIYLSATSVDGEKKWKEKEVDMGAIYTNFYYTFNP